MTRPTLKEMLSDSVVKDVMEADGVDPQELAAMLSAVGEQLRRGATRVAAIRSSSLRRVAYLRRRGRLVWGIKRTIGAGP